MNRRSLLRGFTAGGTALSAGCLDVIPLSDGRLDEADVFEGYRFDDLDLVVELREDVAVDRVVLFDADTGEAHATVDDPVGTVRFQVLFPNRLESYVSQSLRLRAETPDGRARLWASDPVHGAVRNVDPLPDGRARLEIENQAEAPLLVRFVAIYDDVPNPTVDPQDESFDRSAVEAGAGVVGTAENRPLSPSRTDLAVPSGETNSFETTYAPFVFPGESATCDGGERTATAALVHASGGSAAATFTYRLTGTPTAVEGRNVGLCGDST